MKKVVVFLADGFEEVEGLTVVDLLRRAGAVVETVSVMGKLQIDGPFKNLYSSVFFIAAISFAQIVYVTLVLFSSYCLIFLSSQ